MDTRYTTALHNAASAWAKNKAADSQTMMDLQRRKPQTPEAQARKVSTPNAAQMAILQPELARYGNLGTKLNLFA